ncbi:MAG TPA: preprotein translocase subunit SecA, partial [Candidatus Moranbacteria bacterium]|nr:preprotein translocase subunit SecA [Candidatus Moranbacteria bacterium]
GLRGYGQRDPLIEYKKESYNLFTTLMNTIRSNIVNTMFKISPIMPTVEVEAEEKQAPVQLEFSGAKDQVEQFGALKKMQENASSNKQGENVKQQPLVSDKTVGRNDPCPCGSGKKYKKCCGLK